jgi:antibiotic biosynthesis monooxygenase (ABM) superfamily enzyme
MTTVLGPSIPDEPLFTIAMFVAVIAVVVLMYTLVPIRKRIDSIKQRLRRSTKKHNDSK